MNIITSSDIKQGFENNTGLNIRSMSLSEYLNSDLYLNDISIIANILDEEESDVDISNYKQTIKTYVEDIIKVYASVFESSFEAERAVGVMDERYFYTVKNGECVIEEVVGTNGELKSSMNKYLICDYLKQIGYNSSQSFLFDINMVNSGIVHFPLLILRFVMGCSTPNNSKLSSYVTHPECGGNWSIYSEKVIKPYLTLVLNKNTKNAVKGGINPKNVLASLQLMADTLKTCCVVIKYSEDIAITLRGYITGIEGDSAKLLADSLAMDIASEKHSFIVGDNGSFILTLIRNNKKYTSLPLFAYQALDAAKRNNRLPSWNDLIIGRYVRNDKMFRKNFGGGDLTEVGVYHVVAGSRAGKGVMCLSILASILGSGLPIMYADGKPDMSLTLKDVCENACLIDASEDLVTPNIWSYLKNTEAYELYKDNYFYYGGLIYLRFIQLALIIADLRKYLLDGNTLSTLTKEDLGWNSLKGEWDDFIVFLDEFERAMSNVAAACSLFDPKKYKALENSPKEIREIFQKTGELRKFCEDAPNFLNFGNKLKNWMEDISTAVAAADSATLGKGKVRFFLIYQNYYSAIADENIVFEAFKKIKRQRCFVGRDTNFLPESTTMMKINDEAGYITKRFEERAFFYAGKDITGKTLTSMEKVENAIKIDRFVPFKAYLLLNNSDINADCAKEFFKNVGEFASEFAITDDSGNVVDWKDKRVGFEDYINDMLSSLNNGASAKSILSVGRTIVDKVVSVIGYENYLDFISDLNSSSLLSVNELVGAIKSGTVIKGNSTVSVSNNKTPVGDGVVGFGSDESSNDTQFKSQSNNSKQNNSSYTETPISFSTNSRRDDYYRRQYETAQQRKLPSRSELIALLTKTKNMLFAKNPEFERYLSDDVVKEVIESTADAYLEYLKQKG